MMRLPRVRCALLFVAALTAPAWTQGHGDEAARDKWQKVDEIFAAMDVKPGAVVADVGAGGGYFTSRLSRAVGADGRVYAVDIGADVLRRLGERVEREGMKNVELVRGAVDDPKLPAGTLDAALIVNAYHEMTQHQAMLARVKAALKPAGRLVIVEPISSARRDKSRDEQTRSHEIALEYVLKDAREAGFTQVRAQDPFTTRSNGQHDDEWILVLTPASQRQSSAPAETNEEWKSADLRISPEAFKRLPPEEVLVLDVRDPESYRSGHIPGAVLMTPEELSKPDTIARLKDEKRRIVTYCS